jgi:hypothetical protein
MRLADFPDKTVNSLVEQRLKAFAKQAHAFGVSAEESKK